MYVFENGAIVVLAELLGCPLRGGWVNKNIVRKLMYARSAVSESKVLARIKSDHYSILDQVRTVLRRGAYIDATNYDGRSALSMVGLLFTCTVVLQSMYPFGLNHLICCSRVGLF